MNLQTSSLPAGNSFRIVNCQTVIDGREIEDAFIEVCDGIITGAGCIADSYPLKDPLAELDGEGSWVLPGFIDVHVHGGGGCDVMDGTREALDTISRSHALHGTTSLVATTMTCSKEEIDKALGAVYRYRKQRMPYTRILGIHMEGPFISPQWPGAQHAAYILPPDIPLMEEWNERYPDTLRLVTLAPEEEGALDLIGWLVRKGIIAACGHTHATFEEIGAAVAVGLRHSVHCFNAMRSLHHREPGTVGAILADPRLSTEVIADGHHVHPAMVRLLAEVKKDRLLLVTDAMAAAGLGDGAYQLGGQPVQVKQGVARLDNGSLAGSTLTMLDAFRFMTDTIALPVAEASRLASGNPARLLGLDEQLGSVAPGKRADLLLLSKDWSLKAVWVDGRNVLDQD